MLLDFVGFQIIYFVKIGLHHNSTSKISILYTIQADSGKLLQICKQDCLKEKSLYLLRYTEVDYWYFWSSFVTGSSAFLAQTWLPLVGDSDLPIDRTFNDKWQCHEA